LENHDTVTVGYLNSYLPYSGTNSSGKVNGLVKELIPKIFYSIDVDDMKVDYVAYDSYDEMMAGINTGEIDVAFPVGGGVYYSEQNGIYQTEPFISISTDLVYRDVIINPDAATFAINSKNSMQLYYAQTYYPNAKIVYYDSIDECLDAVLKGEVDCTTLNGLRATEILKNYKYNRLSVRQLSERDGRCLGVKIGNDGLLRILNRGIHIMDDDYVESISYKYAGDLYKRSFADWLDTYMIFIFLVFVAIIILGMLLLLLRIRGLKTRITGLINSNKNQMKLIDNIANSIREPVDEIYDISNMAKESISDIDLVNKGLGIIIDKSYDMKAIADKVTEISLLDRGKVELERDKFNIVQLVKGIETEGIQKAERKGLTFKFEVGQIKNKDLIGDKVRTEQILKTVLDNAIKFTPEGGQVSFNVLEQPSKNVSRARIVFTIKDNGVGISEDYQPFVFDAFTKECNEDGKTGVGLGLPIAKRLVDLMDGTIQVNSEKNNGCEVVITIDYKINYN
jgi:signal transduction histidine kinase